MRFFFFVTGRSFWAYTVATWRILRDGGETGLWALILVLLAGYGLFALLTPWFVQRSAAEDASVSAVVVVVDRAEDWIEWFVRKISGVDPRAGRNRMDVLIVDLGGSLEAAMIISRLQRDYPFITYVPSSPERCWKDVVALLEASRRQRTLLIQAESREDVRGVARLISQWAR